MLSFRRATPNDLSRIVAIYNSAVPSHDITDDEMPITVDSRQEKYMAVPKGETL